MPVIDQVSGFVLSIVGALIGAFVQRKYDHIVERRPLNQILNFGDDAILFVFPHRAQIAEAILPQTSTEDFLAMNNFMSALLAIGWTNNVGVRDMNRVSSDDKRKNLVVICSPKSNTFAQELQDILKNKNQPIFEFTPKQGPEWAIDIGVGQVDSKSFLQEIEYSRQDVPRNQFPEKRFDDLAVVTKVRNPWNEKNKIIWLAGLRGIGTWAAGECIKKHWQDIYVKLPSNQKECDFTALLDIEYKNSDITKIVVSQVRVLNQT